MIHYATFEGFPCVYTWRHAWVRYADQPWKEWPLAEVHHYARVLTEAQFRQRFPRLEIPEAAFQPTT